MKRVFNKLFLFLSVLSLNFFTACFPIDEPESPIEETEANRNSQETVYFSSIGGTRNNIAVPLSSAFGVKEFECNTPWIVDITPQKYGSPISVTVLPNESSSDRSGIISVYENGNAASTILIWQYGKKTLTPTSAPYAVGDIYFENGVSGVVYKITDNGMHGMITSLTDTICKWGIAYEETGAVDLYNGFNNMTAVKQLENWQSLYPPFHWCDKMNTDETTGWYLPAFNELMELYLGFSGLPRYQFDADADRLYRKARDKFNSTLLLYNGNIIKEDGVYSCSSEFTQEGSFSYGFEAWCIIFTFGTDIQRDKSYDSYFRAVRAF